jgi:hypothetical protein
MKTWICVVLAWLVTQTYSQSNYSYLQNSQVKVGVDLDRGGAIAWVSQASSSRNLVNIHDEGRYIQQSYYAGATLDRTAEGQWAPQYSPWSWNPVQAGDVYKNRSALLLHTNDGTVLYTKTLPKLWDMNNEDAESYMEQWIALQDGVVHVRNRLTSFRTDTRWGVKLQPQEIPAVYIIASLPHLRTYLGDAPFTGAAHVETHSGWPWTPHVNLERWAAYVDNTGWGLGVFSPTASEMLCGRAGDPVGEALDGNTNYISPTRMVALQEQDVYEFEYWLTIGSVEQIRATAEQRAGMVAFPSKFFFDTEGDFEGFVMANDLTGTVNGGVLTVSLTGGDPYFTSQEGLYFDATQNHWLILRVRNRTNSQAGQLFFSRKDRPGQLYSVPLALPANDGQYHNVILDMNTLSTDWGNRIAFFRIDPVNSGSGALDFDVIAFHDQAAVPPPDPGASSSSNQSSSSQASSSSAAHVRGSVNHWDFTGSLEGWTLGQGLSYGHHSSMARLTISTTDPQMVSPSVLGLAAADYPFILVGMRNRTTDTGAELYWTRNTAPSYNETKKIAFTLIANDDAQRTYVLDLSGHSAWRDTLVQLRLDPVASAATGSVNLDFVKFSGAYPVAVQPALLPGVVEVENFDLGGEGNAYHDSSPANEGGAYRSGEGVDIQSISGGGYAVGWVHSGEWLQYLVRVEEEFDADLGLWAASFQAGDSVRFLLNGRPLGETIAFSGGDDLSIYRRTSTQVRIPAGIHVLRLEVLRAAGGLNIDRLEVIVNDAPVSIPLRPNSPLPQKMHSKIYDLKGRRL